MWCEGRGNWNDDDMLEVGNKGLTIAEQRTHFALCTTQLRPAPLTHVMLPVAWRWLSVRLLCQGAW